MSGSRQRQRILVVDDNEDAAESLVMWLELLGHDAAVATDASGAIANAREVRPHTMLCDIDLPDMSGYDLARAIRADSAFAEVRLIALSGHTRPRDRELAKEAGFDLHLAKPLDPDLLERVLAAEPP